MLHCTKLSRYDFFDKVYSQRWQNLLSTAKGVSLYDDRSNLSDAEVVCTADYPFPIRSSEANYPSWDKKSHYPYHEKCHVKTLYLPGGISCHLSINDDGKIRSISIQYKRPHGNQADPYKKIDARGWSEPQLIQLFTDLSFAVTHWKEEDDYINMEFDKIEKIRAIRKVVAQLKKKIRAIAHSQTTLV